MALDVRNCTHCGRIYNYVTGQPICASCKRKLEDKFKNVKLYLRRHPEATIHQVATDNEVEVNQIRQWIREERITFSRDSVVGIECERCGVMIKTGRYCAKCKSEVTSELKTATNTNNSDSVGEPVKENDSRNKMRFLNRK